MQFLPSDAMQSTILLPASVHLSVCP